MKKIIIGIIVMFVIFFFLVISCSILLMPDWKDDAREEIQKEIPRSVWEKESHFLGTSNWDAYKLQQDKEFTGLDGTKYEYKAGDKVVIYRRAFVWIIKQDGTKCAINGFSKSVTPNLNYCFGIDYEDFQKQGLVD